MKVIKEGKKPGFRKKVTCRTCHSILEVEAGDLNYRTEDGWQIGEVTCPVCEATVEVTSEMIE